MSVILRRLALLLGLAGTGCTQQTTLHPNLAPAIATTQIFVGTCVFAPQPAQSGLLAELAASTAGAGIDAILSFVGNALRAAGEDSPKSSDAAFGVFFASAKQPPSCIQVVRGRFALRKADTAVSPSWLADAALDEKTWNEMRSHQIYLLDSPDFLFEGTFAPAIDGSAYTLQPTYLAFGRSLEDDGLTFHSSRHITVAIDILAPGGDDRPIGSTAIHLGQIIRGSVLCFEIDSARPNTCRGTDHSFKDDSASDGKIQPVPVGPKTEIKPWSGGAWNTPWFRLPLADQPAPYMVKVVVTEIRDGNAAAKFLSAVFTSAQPQIATALKDQAEIAIDRQKLQEAHAKAASDAAASRDTYNSKLSAAVGLLKTCKEATPSDQTGVFKAAVAALSAQDAANAAALAAALPVPFPPATLVPRKGTQSAIDACTKAYDNAVT